MKTIPELLQNIDPMVIAVSIGIGIYLVIIALLPKNILFKTRYTKKHIKVLENAQIAPDVEDSLIMDGYKSKGVLARAFYALPFSDFFHPSIVRAGLEAKVDKLFLSCLIAFEVVLVGLSVMKVSIAFPFIVIISVAAAYIFGWMIVSRAIAKRTAKFVGQFSDALDIIVRSVTSGFPVNAAVNMVHESMDSPIKDEFKQISDEVLYGSTLVDALDRLSERMRLPDVRFFAVVLTLQQEVGGNLAETLSNLSGLIRKRRIMRMKIHALTSEGRSTGWILGALPVFVGGVVYYMTPDYLAPLFQTSSGNHVLIAAASSIAIGVGIVRAMTSMEI